jgi:hypothetical protein
LAGPGAGGSVAEVGSLASLRGLAGLHDACAISDGLGSFG